jgi:hypothetical protein
MAITLMEITTTDAGTILGVTDRRVRQMVAEGRFRKVRRIGRNARYIMLQLAEVQTVAAERNERKG